MFRASLKFVGRRLWELVTNNWGQIIVWLGGTSMMYYLGSITEWARSAGPLGWALIAVATMFVISAGFALWSLASVRRSTQALALAKVRAGHVNVLAQTHNRERMNVVDFYSPFFLQVDDIRFEDCELLGPASVHLQGGTIRYCHFIECEIVIVRGDRPVRGVTAFMNPIFLRTKFIRVTLLMNIVQYNGLPDDMKKGVAVISDGRVGDI